MSKQFRREKERKKQIEKKFQLITNVNSESEEFFAALPPVKIRVGAKIFNVHCSPVYIS